MMKLSDTKTISKDGNYVAIVEKANNGIIIAIMLLTPEEQINLVKFFKSLVEQK